MTGQILSIFLDVAVLICFGFTIFYVLKLSRSLNNFRDQRQHMNKLIEMLSKNIDEALRAIDGLKIAGDRSGRDLQKIINESKAMADELQMINETSNSLASRLEGLAQGTRVIAGHEGPMDYYEEPEIHKSALKSTSDKPAFFIHDREYNDGAPDEEEEDVPEGLQSQAEKELMEALRKNKKFPSRGAF